MSGEKKEKEKKKIVKGSAEGVEHVQNFRVLSLKNGVDIGL